MPNSNDTTPCPIYLPPSISSSHDLCKDAISNNSDTIVKLSDQYLLAKVHYENEEYEKARRIFEDCRSDSIEAKYQLAVMYYDGLGGPQCHREAFNMMLDLVTMESTKHQNLIHCAQYNIGRAYYEGIGVSQSDDEAEKWWLLSAQNGERQGCVKSQSVIAMFYSKINDKQYDLKKAHFWHQEATGNGSLESQGALGVMYKFGIGVKKDSEAAFKCFKSASERGNVYAMGNLALHYYKNKMFTNAAEISKRVGSLQDTKQLSIQSNCLETFIKKGIALGCFIYGRCLEKGLADIKENNEVVSWYSRAAEFDADTAQDMQDMVTHGTI